MPSPFNRQISCPLCLSPLSQLSHAGAGVATDYRPACHQPSQYRPSSSLSVSVYPFSVSRSLAVLLSLISSSVALERPRRHQPPPDHYCCERMQAIMRNSPEDHASPLLEASQPPSHAPGRGRHCRRPPSRIWLVIIIWKQLMKRANNIKRWKNAKVLSMLSKTGYPFTRRSSNRKKD
ncbi:hypothetical protein Cgig2_009779 [Carnegiea gigantea]|uniref:Uncharacterized protein n=1 Tax=Carnegiea gigantea TaxID=171969 RepID=A0A9Q1Q4P1_9CARY|nr:hypothetical protein Cgig2_009779 [Carnegiea gigantea]